MVKRFFSIVGTGNHSLKEKVVKNMVTKMFTKKWPDYDATLYLMISSSESKSTGDIKFW